MRLALYQPDIPQNTGTLLRTAACLDVAVDIIQPAGFDLSDRTLRRAGLDYLEHVEITRHRSFATFEEWRAETDPMPRLVLLSRQGTEPYTRFTFAPADILLVGRESAGVPDEVRDRTDARITIPLRPGLRSLNVAIAAAMVLGEALRQTAGFPSGVAAGDLKSQ